MNAKTYRRNLAVGRMAMEGKVVLLYVPNRHSAKNAITANVTTESLE